MNKDDLIKNFEGKAQQVGRRNTPYGDILVAERYVPKDSVWEVPDVAAAEFPNGMFQTWYIVCRGEEADGYGTVFFHANHDLDLPIPMRQEARINATVQKAMELIEANVESGRYARH